MGTRFQYPNKIEVVVDIASPNDIEGRLISYKLPASVRSSAKFEIYAEATYLKYQTANTNFGVVSTTSADLVARMKPGKRTTEVLVLIEGTRTDNNSIIGAALLRFAWTGDLVFDFVGINPNARGVGERELKNLGSCLIYEGLRLAKMFNAKEVFAETAEHSYRWWHNHLAQGSDLIKASSVDDAFANTKAHLTRLIITAF